MRKPLSHWRASRGKLDRWKADLRMAEGVLSDPNVLALLADPNMSPEHKRQVIDRPSPWMWIPVCATCSICWPTAAGSRRWRAWSRSSWRWPIASRASWSPRVTTAVPLDAKGQQAVAERLKRLAGAKQVELRNSVDPAILGGIIARIGDELYDGSVRTQLTQLAERIS